MIDGVFLLHAVGWRKGSTFEQICMDYVSYVTRISTDAAIVFDGYNESNTKDHAHQKGILCSDYVSNLQWIWFLSNTGNK